MMAPSAVECPAVHQSAVAMINKMMVEKFIKAVVRVKKAGIDGVFKTLQMSGVFFRIR